MNTEEIIQELKDKIKVSTDIDRSVTMQIILNYSHLFYKFKNIRKGNVWIDSIIFKANKEDDSFCVLVNRCQYYTDGISRESLTPEKLHSLFKKVLL